MTTSTAKLKSNVLMYSDQVGRGTLTVESEKVQRKTIDDQMRDISNEITKTRDMLFEFEKCETAPGRDTTKH